MEKDMHRFRIKNENDPRFQQVWAIYRSSFPLREQRTPEHQRTAFGSPLYRMDAYRDGERTIGFIDYWIFPDYAYIEHYAMAEAVRGQGYGTKILGDFLRRMEGKTVVLEIDPVVDEVSTRRLEFYEKLGFRESPFRHACPKYQPDETEGELWVLSWPTTVDCDFYERFYNDLHNVVMAR
jgi:ribosomal protein S18 acetylase RimI-like enzyme